MSLHLELKERIEERYGAQLPEGAETRQDALLLRFDSGVTMELRFASAQEYSIGWLWGDAELRIDTAPLHPHLETQPNHCHDEEGKVRADLLTRPGDPPWDNARNVIDAVLADPLLQGRKR